jgi:hypothetical protein
VIQVAVLAGWLKSLFRQVTVEHIDPWVAMLWAIWAVGHSRVDDGAREGNFHGLTARLLLSSRRLAGEALEERSFTARKTLSQQVQQV